MRRKRSSRVHVTADEAVIMTAHKLRVSRAPERAAEPGLSAARSGLRRLVRKTTAQATLRPGLLLGISASGIKSFLAAANLPIATATGRDCESALCGMQYPAERSWCEEQSRRGRARGNCGSHGHRRHPDKNRGAVNQVSPKPAQAGPASVFVTWEPSQRVAVLLEALTHWVQQQTRPHRDLHTTFFWINEFCTRRRPSAAMPAVALDSSACSALGRPSAEGAIEDATKLPLVIERLPQCVVLMEPWHAPTVLQRPRCLLEMYHASANAEASLREAARLRAIAKANPMIKHVGKDDTTDGSAADPSFACFDGIMGNSTRDVFHNALMGDFGALPVAISQVDIEDSLSEDTVDTSHRYSCGDLDDSRGHDKCSDSMGAFVSESERADDALAVAAARHLTGGSAAVNQGLKQRLRGWVARAAQARLDAVPFLQQHLTAASLRMQLGRLLQQLERSSEAEPLLRQAVDGYRAMLLPGHPELVAAVHNLGCVLQNQGRTTRAEPLLREALSSMRGAHGDGDNRVRKAMYNLASLMSGQGRYEEAEQLLRAALDGANAELGEGHAIAVDAGRRLALLLKLQGRLNEAEPLLRRAAEGHCNTATIAEPAEAGRTLREFAAILYAQGRLSEAEPVYREALAAREGVFGRSHVETAQYREELAQVLQNQGALDEAEALMRQTLEVLRSSTTELAAQDALDVRGRIVYRGVDAATIGRDWLHNRRHALALGYGPIRVVQAAARLADILTENGGNEKLKDAERLYREALSGQRCVLGNTHRDTLATMHSLGMTLIRVKQIDEAASLLREAAHGFNVLFGPAHRATRASCDALLSLEASGTDSLATGHELEDASEEVRCRLEVSVRDAVEGREGVLGIGSPQTLASINNLALLCHSNGKHDEAIANLREALTRSRVALGDTHPHTLAFARNLVQLLRATGQHCEVSSVLPVPFAKPARAGLPNLSVYDSSN